MSSLPGGKLGREAFRFVDWLVEAGQSWWALLPLGPPDWAGSPYSSSSAFAAPRGLPGEAARAGDRGRARGVRRAASTTGPATGRRSRATARFADQVRFDREWSALRRYAADRGVRLFGDIPIYVAARGADVAAHPELFQEGVVAGAPPDALSSVGQLWGNPLYDWRGAAGAGLPLVGRAAPPDVRALRPRADRPLPRLRLLLVGAGRATGPRSAAAGGAARAPSSSARPSGELGRLPLVAEDLGVITPRGPPAPRRARHPRHGRDAVRLRGSAVEHPPAREPPAARSRLRRDARLRHRARLVAQLSPRRARARDRSARVGAALGADRGCALLTGRARDRSRPRTSSASAPRRG